MSLFRHIHRRQPSKARPFFGLRVQSNDCTCLQTRNATLALVARIAVCAATLCWTIKWQSLLIKCVKDSKGEWMCEDDFSNKLSDDGLFSRVQIRPRHAEEVIHVLLSLVPLPCSRTLWVHVPPAFILALCVQDWRIEALWRQCQWSSMCCSLPTCTLSRVV